MLIQITNTCHMMCEHCFQSSTPEAAHMSDINFSRAVDFTKVIGGVATISGGEPTCHPKFYEFIKDLNFTYKLPFVICTNGSWYDNEDLVTKFKRIGNWEYCIAIQVYTNPKWYKMSEEILNHRAVFNSIPKCFLETSDIIAMEDLGRAKTSPRAQQEVANNPYAMSCINPALTVAQSRNVNDLKAGLRQLVLSGKGNCKPFIDWQGKIHMSESIHCPSMGQLGVDSYLDIFQKMLEFKPCGACRNYQNFLNSSKPQHIMARQILGL